MFVFPGEQQSPASMKTSPEYKSLFLYRFRTLFQLLRLLFLFKTLCCIDDIVSPIPFTKYLFIDSEFPLW